MKRSRVALYEFMPYGAPELIEVSDSNLTRALTTSTLGLCVLFALALGLSTFVARHGGVAQPPIDRIFEFQPPPSIDMPLVPRIQELVPTAPVHGAIPVPVRDEVAPPDAVIPTQAQLSHEGAGTSPDATQPVAPPAPPVDVTPGLRDWVPYDEPPGVVSAIKPTYPDIAREAGVEGTVRVRVLVGLDGHVRDVHVDTSVPLLDEAAVAAARQWVFTPALSNGHAVMVWVAIPIRFSLH